jgi:hypothetical protein
MKQAALLRGPRGDREKEQTFNSESLLILSSMWSATPVDHDNVIDRKFVAKCPHGLHISVHAGGLKLEQEGNVVLGMGAHHNSRACPWWLQLTVLLEGRRGLPRG